MGSADDDVGATATGLRTPVDATPADPVGDTVEGPVSADPQRIIAGTAIGHFRVEGLLGRGGMGVVYAALDTRLNRRVAIKLVLGEVAGSVGSDRRARLEREALALARLSHPNVIAVFEIGEHAGQLYIVMELVDGETLGRRLAALAAGPDRWREVLAVFLAAGEGLAAAHAAGLVHRDFKPDNVLVSRGGRVHVMDFGVAHNLEALGEPRSIDALATAAPSLTQTGALVGTPAYMSPEQFRGEKVDARSDQFAFCVALYEALFARRPFVAATVAALVAEVLEGPAPAFDADLCPPAVVAALRRGLARDPAARFADMGELLAELRASLELRDAASPSRRAAPRRMLVVVGLASAAVLAAGLFFALRTPTDETLAPLEGSTGSLQAMLGGPGVLAGDEIRAVVRAHTDEVRECYNQALMIDDTRGGRVVIRGVIGLAGNVESASIAESSLDDPFLGTCIAARMMAWRFPAPVGGKVTFQYPFLLEPA